MNHHEHRQSATASLSAGLIFCAALTACGGSSYEVATQEPAWSQPTMLAQGDVGQPNVSATVLGDAIAGWSSITQTTPFPASYTQASRLSQSVWTASENISDRGKSTFDYPRFALINSSGEILLAWNELDLLQRSSSMRGNRFVPGFGWQGPRDIVPGHSGALQGVVLSNDGVATIAWTDSDTGHLTTARSSRSGQLDLLYDHGSVYETRIVQDPQGFVTLAYTGKSTDGLYSTWAVRAKPTGQWEPAIAIGPSRPPSGHSCFYWWCIEGDFQLDLAVNAEGTVAATWETYDGSTSQQIASSVWMNLSPRGADWIGPLKVATVARDETASYPFPRVILFENSGGVVLWQAAFDQSQTGEALWFRQYSPTQGLLGPLRIPDMTGRADLGGVNIVPYEGSGLLVSWYDLGAHVALGDLARNTWSVTSFAPLDPSSSSIYGNTAISASGRLATLVWSEGSGTVGGMTIRASQLR